MRWNGSLISIALASMLSASPGVAATFGTAVPIGGHASDIVLDEARGVVANKSKDGGFGTQDIFGFCPGTSCGGCGCCIGLCALGSCVGACA